MPMPSYRCNQVGMWLYVLVSELRPLLAQNDILIQYRAPKRADPDQPNSLSLASAGGCNFDACACFLGSTWRGDHGLSYDHELLWAFWQQFERILFIKKHLPKYPKRVRACLLLASVNYSTTSSRRRQKTCFEAQLSCARECGSFLVGHWMQLW